MREIIVSSKRAGWMAVAALLIAAAVAPVQAGETPGSEASARLAPPPAGPCGQAAPAAGFWSRSAPAGLSLPDVDQSMGPPWFPRTCRCSCGYPCETNEDCGAGGTCTSGITCCEADPLGLDVTPLLVEPRELATEPERPSS